MTAPVRSREWFEAMLDRARRVCTAAKKHVEWSRQWAVSPGRDGVSVTMRELEAAIDELMRDEADGNKRRSSGGAR